MRPAKGREFIDAYRSKQFLRQLIILDRFNESAQRGDRLVDVGEPSDKQPETLDVRSVGVDDRGVVTGNGLRNLGRRLSTKLDKALLQ